jgi:hypothetical protein
MHRNVLLKTSLLIFCAFASVLAQGNMPKRYIFTSDWTYELLDYRINRGDYRPDFVLSRPYTIDDVQESSGDARWQSLMNRHYARFYGKSGTVQLGLYGRDNFAIVSDADLPVRKGLRAAPMHDVLLYDNRTKNHYNGALQLNLMLPHIVLVNRTTVNSEFKDDPGYYGDTGEWIYGRVNDAYLNANAGPFDFFIGRMDRNWGGLATPGLILSDNPYSYDHAQFTFTSKVFKFTMMVSRLEDLPAVVVEAPDSVFTARKFISAHRFDFCISPDLQFALTEIAIYGGPDRDFEMGFLNPMNFFYLVQRNNGKQMNGMWAADLFYKPARQVDLLCQVLFDDFIINNEPEQDDRAQFPDRLGILLQSRIADFPVPGLQVRFEYARLSNRTYQSRRTYENFHYQEKSMGYPVSSIEKLGLAVKYFNLYPAIVSVHGSFQRSGDVKMTDVFPLQREKFPVGIVENNWELNMDVKYFPQSWLWLTSTVGYEYFTNYKHMAGDDRSNFKLILGAHVNLSFRLKVL